MYDPAGNITRYAPEFALAFRRFDEQNVGAGFRIDPRPLDCRIEAVFAARIRSCDDEEVAVGPRIRRRFDPPHHFVDRRELPSRFMAAALASAV